MTIRSYIKALDEYKPPLEGRASSNSLLLDFNERTTSLPEHIKNALIDYITNNNLERYPEYGDFFSKLSEYTKTPPSSLLITNGSDQAIDLIFRLISKPSCEAIVPLPTFYMLNHSAKVNNLKTVNPLYNKDFSYPFKKVIQLISPKTKIITICSPNNPTGTLLKVEEIEYLCKNYKEITILVDECYYEFSKVTVANLVDKYENLFISRTFSKTWGLASLRLGYIISSKKNISELKKIRGPYDINTLAVIAAKEALKNKKYMKDFVKEVMGKSKPLLENYLDSKKIKYIKSDANFILIFFKNSLYVHNELKKHFILTRPRNEKLISNSLRITIGSLEQTKTLINALEKIL